MMSCDTLAVQKVGCHEQLQSNFRCNGELRDLRAAVGVADFVVEVHAHLAEDMGAMRGKGRGGEEREGKGRGGERRGGEGRGGEERREEERRGEGRRGE